MTLTDLKARISANQYRYSTSAYNQIVKLLERSEARITSQLREILEGLSQREIQQLLRGSYSTRRLVKLRENIRELAAEARRSVGTGIKTSGTELADLEIDETRAILKALGVAELGTTVSATQAYAAAVSRPMLGRFVRDEVKDLDANFRRQFFAAIREGFVNGESVSRIVARIKGTAPLRYRDGLLFTRKRSIERIVRTSLNHIANVANQQALVEAGIEEYEWLSTLDGRTSSICASLDGQVFRVGEGRLPPAHQNCRSTTLPWLGEPTGGYRPFVADDRPVSRIPKNQLDGKIGRVQASTKFPEWFDRQDRAFQREWLGATRYRLYREGEFKLDRFVDKRGTQYNLDELRQRNQEAFAQLEI